MLTKEYCNEYLLRIYGRSQGTENPRYRIVFSDDCTEKRLVEEDSILFGVCIGSSKRILEVPKYPFVKGRYVFEFHFPTDNPELTDHEGNYEPLYVFQDYQGNPLPLDLEVIDFICWGLRQHVVKKTPEMLEGERLEKMAKEAALEYERLDDALPYLPTMMKRGEATFIDSKKVMITDVEP